MKDLTSNFKELLGIIDAKPDNSIERALVKSLFCKLSENHPEAAKDLIDKFKGRLEYNNYLTKEEAMEIVQNMVFDDSDKKGKTPWPDPKDLFENMGDGSGYNTEEVTSSDLIDDDDMVYELKGYFNKWALWVCINKYYADNYCAFNKWVRNSDLLRPCYDFAVEQLMDQDKPHWIRWYFGLD